MPASVGPPLGPGGHSMKITDFRRLPSLGPILGLQSKADAQTSVAGSRWKLVRNKRIVAHMVKEEPRRYRLAEGVLRKKLNVQGLLSGRYLLHLFFYLPNYRCIISPANVQTNVQLVGNPFAVD